MKKKHKIRLPIGYFPPLTWFYLAEQFEQVEIEASEHYQKSSLRNRCRIAGPNGIQMLSIPLFKGKNQQTPIQSVQISSIEDWQKNHWRSIQTAYGNAPFFMHFAPELAPFFQKKYDSLFEFNVALLHRTLELMRIPLDMKFSESYELDSATEDGRVFFMKKNPKSKQSEMPYYPQVFESVHGFLPNLSILDALFCCGTLPR